MGAERALKAEVQQEWSEFRPAFSKPGFVTFKAPPQLRGIAELDLRSAFARCSGESLGSVQGEGPEGLAERFWQQVGDQKFQQLHVWCSARPANFKGGTDADEHDPLLSVVAALQQKCPAGLSPGETSKLAGTPDESSTPPVAASGHPFGINAVAQTGQGVLSCIIVDRTRWWIGFHKAGSLPSRWPGGVYPVRLPEHAVSRAYAKMAEALAWSRMPVVSGDLCAELGCAPGGSCQLLLERRLRVLGIDPAEMDPGVLRLPGFRHIRKRGREVKKREFREVRWLLADSNVAPTHTLDTVQDIVTHRDANIRGLLLTLKLTTWGHATSLPEFLARIRSWGYRYVKARQLAHGGQEVCVFALRRQGLLRLGGQARRKGLQQR
ncbi:MAG: hypothetical protein CMJ81_04445 [Planctomycetaceae bacterium]|nr:hypothetical protein [Planctomycetaceae bacterium]MBP60413.1 hypothetical protein [Planctomycetaceae bacterium]